MTVISNKSVGLRMTKSSLSIDYSSLRLVKITENTWLNKTTLRATITPMHTLVQGRRTWGTLIPVKTQVRKKSCSIHSRTIVHIVWKLGQHSSLHNEWGSGGGGVEARRPRRDKVLCLRQLLIRCWSDRGESHQANAHVNLRKKPLHCKARLVGKLPVSPVEGRCTAPDPAAETKRRSPCSEMWEANGRKLRVWAKNQAKCPAGEPIFNCRGCAFICESKWGFTYFFRYSSCDIAWELIEIGIFTKSARPVWTMRHWCSSPVYSR